MGAAVNGSGEAMSIMDALWQTNDNLMQLLSSVIPSGIRSVISLRITIRSRHEKAPFPSDWMICMSPFRKAADHPISGHLHGCGKGNGLRAGADLCGNGSRCNGDQKGKRTKSRKQQLLDLYKQVKHEDAPELLAELEAMGDEANSRLQSDKLFLYYLQVGKMCVYVASDRPEPASSQKPMISIISIPSQSAENSILETTKSCAYLN